MTLDELRTELNTKDTKINPGERIYEDRGMEIRKKLGATDGKS